MKPLVGMGELIVMAFVLRFGLHTSSELDLYVHDTYQAVPLRVVAFWCFMETAFAWFLFFAWASIRRSFINSSSI
jgi:hypothetical protein